ncbi:MAG: 23S rRNA (adenine(2503)-C(2))-methyltransferase [Elusimicrobia bacterium RIFCSPHIGHO2_01_FULL_64_10]|nr:MAG: 23S rRNA (adenine(2503)-C(2))-methyltransferase [Elusimicrobia bacterium RIFCSPHIGHO2_01_FULL_64_10]
MRREAPHLLDQTYPDLLSRFPGESYRARQVCTWVFKRRAGAFEDMSDLPQDVRTDLEGRFSLFKLTPFDIERSRVDRTVKIIWKTAEGLSFASVILPRENYQSICVSTQVGCKWGCRFCASGTVPFKRNLSSGEILDQVLQSEKLLGQKVRNVLFMGMGEPLANAAETVKAAGWMTAPEGLGIRPSRIVLSTTGIAPAIRRIAEEGLKVNLALSLHAANDELRKTIMPRSARFPIPEVLEACKFYQARSGAELTIEYILLGGVNDGLEHAEELIRVLKSARFARMPKVNLIPYNPVNGLPYREPSRKSAGRFFEFLAGKKWNVHTRRPQGQDLQAACGQLA